MKTKKWIEWLYVTLGVALTAFSFSFFLEPSSLVIGGVSGLGIIFKELLMIDTALMIFIINLGLLLVGLIFLGKDFFLKTAYGSLLFPGFIKLFNIIYDGLQLEPITDTFLVIIFASLIMGIGLGLVIKNGGTTGGIEIPQKLMQKYLHIPYSVTLYLLDGLIVLSGYFVFHNLSFVLYGFVFIYLCGFVIDQVVFSGFNKRAVYIISSKSEEIRQFILHDLERGVTQMRIVGGFTNQERDKLVCILSNFEFYRLKNIIYKLDPFAFFYVVRASEVGGEGFTYEK